MRARPALSHGAGFFVANFATRLINVEFAVSSSLSRLVWIAVLSLGAVVHVSAQAQTMSCQAAAAEKKLAGAAKNSFLKKCERDAATACDVAATDKKLSGAARTSFSKKCVRDAVGQPPAK